MIYRKGGLTIKFLIVLLVQYFNAGAQASHHPASSMDHNPCDSSAANMPGQFKKLEDEDFYDKDKQMEREISKRTDAVIQLVKETFPKSRGFEAWYYKGGTGPDDKPYIPNGPKYYRITIPFFPFSCGEVKDSVTHMKELLAGNISASKETGTWMYISFNNPAWLAGGGEKMLVDGKYRKVFEMSSSLVDYWDGFPITGSGILLTGSSIFPENEGFGNGVPNPSIFILVTRKNEKAFIPLSRKQYLAALLDKYEKKYEKDTADRGRQIDYFQKQVEKDKQNIQLGDKRARQNLISDQYELKRLSTDKSAENTLSSNSKDINNYLGSTPEDSLKLPATIYGYTGNKKCVDWFRPDPKSDFLPTVFVTTNFTYWHTGQNKAVPQMIAVRMRFENTNWHSLQIKKQFERNFPIEKLQALLDK